MTKVSKNAKILISLVLLVLAFCSSLSVTFSYFSATASKNGTINFPDLKVNFVALNEKGETINEDSTIKLYPVGGTIVRGEPFQLSLTSITENATQTPIGELAIKNRNTSCDAYVRFWVDAYIVNDDGETLNKTKNYGEYFLLDDSYNPETESAPAFARGGCAKPQTATEGYWCYYLTSRLYSTGGSSQKPIKNTLTLSNTMTDSVYSEIVGRNIQISISLEAVQHAHQAFQVEFDDVKGYYSAWN